MSCTRTKSNATVTGGAPGTATQMPSVTRCAVTPLGQPLAANKARSAAVGLGASAASSCAPSVSTWAGWQGVTCPFLSVKWPRRHKHATKKERESVPACLRKECLPEQTLLGVGHACRDRAPAAFAVGDIFGTEQEAFVLGSWQLPCRTTGHAAGHAYRGYHGSGGTTLTNSDRTQGNGRAHRIAENHA